MSSDPSRRLRLGLRGNAGFSAASGAVLALASGPVADFLGPMVPAPLVAVVGVSLLAFAGSLVALSLRPAAPRGAVVAVVGADVGWVIATIGVVFADVLSRAGAIAALAVANVVLAFAALQWTGGRRAWARSDAALHPREAASTRGVVFACGALVLLPIVQWTAEQLVPLPIGPSRMLTIGLWALAWVPLAGQVMVQLDGGAISRSARLTVGIVVPLLLVAHLMALSRLRDRPFGPLPGGPFVAAASAAPASWEGATPLRYAEIEVDRDRPRTLETLVLVRDGGLYVAANMPERKRWPSAVRRDGQLRIRLGTPEVHTLRARFVDTSVETSALLEAMVAKYGFDVSMGGPIWFFALEPLRPSPRVQAVR